MLLRQWVLQEMLQEMLQENLHVLLAQMYLAMMRRRDAAAAAARAPPAARPALCGCGAAGDYPLRRAATGRLHIGRVAVWHWVANGGAGASCWSLELFLFFTTSRPSPRELRDGDETCRILECDKFRP